MATALQDIVSPQHTCFGCGPANARGLQIKSYPDPDGVHIVATVLPEEHFCGWPGLVYGGFLAMLCDCHSNWTAIAAQYRLEGREPGQGPEISCVTGTLGVKYLKPTPMGVPLRLKARTEGPVGRKMRILCEIYAGEELVVTGDSIFFRAEPAVLAEKAHTT